MKRTFEGRHHDARICELVETNGLDKRKTYSVWCGVLCTDEVVTTECSGCTEFVDGHRSYGPLGCEECGYTGKRRQHFPAPVLVEGRPVPLDEGKDD